MISTAYTHVALLVLAALLASACAGQVPHDGFLKLGGFRCVDLRPFANDDYFDLYQTAAWSNASFRMDVWKRLGVPYWYPEGAGNVRIAGAEWRPPESDVVSDVRHGAVAHADAQRDGNAARFANDDDPYSYWYAGDDRRGGKLWIDFKEARRVKEVRFLGWDTGRHAPKAYRIGLILPDGTRSELADVEDERRMGEWIVFPVANVEAVGVYLDVSSTIEGRYGPVIYELQARGLDAETGPSCHSEVVIPLKGQTAEELCFLGQVGGGFDSTPGVETPVGEYTLVYRNGEEETWPLVAGRNVACTKYGCFVPDAQFAWGLRDREAALESVPEKLHYHLGELAEVEPKRQLMVFSKLTAHPSRPLRELRFRCTNPRAFLILQGLTLRQTGPRMNVLTYNGRRLKPTPGNAPKASPSWVEAQRDPTRTLRLDGPWRYAVDPADRGIRSKWFDPSFDARAWGKMAVPSQWYVQGLDYHGVVWFRRTFDVPAGFPGEAAWLEFERVDYDARVWVNGVYVGRHVGAYSSFELDATRALKKGAGNLIVVRVDSPLDPGFSGYKTLVKGNAMDDIAMPYDEEGSMGGIYRSVFLVGRGAAMVCDVWASSQIDGQLRNAKVTVRCKVSGAGALTVKCRLTEPGKPPKARVFSAHQTVSDAQSATVEFALDIREPKLWWPWEQGPPNLHTLEVEVWRGNELLDRHVSRVGIKQIERNEQENCLYVNHHRVFLKGALNDDNHWQSMLDRTGYLYRIQAQKDANLNVIRLTTHQSSPEFYELCDEMGMMVWQEMPLQWSYSASPAIHKDILQIVAETVRQTRRHACVIGYSAWNEGGQSGFTDEVTRLIASEDPTRPMTRASGGGDWDVHVYPTQTRSLSRCTPLWSGLTYGFISETGAYGISDLEHLREMFGNDLFAYAGAEYFWETFASYRQYDGPAYMESPPPVEWPTEKIRDYVLERVDASERFFWQVMKSMFEVTRAQRFAPTASCIYCRFDDPFPTAFLGMMNFVGRPLKAYFGVREACRQVLPIMMFDSQGASDVRVVNEYWFRSWKGCLLRYELRSYDGKLVRRIEKPFDLGADSTVKVLDREEVGDIWHAPGGIKAKLSVVSAAGAELSENRYDFNAQEVRAFTRCLYPVAPMKPLDAVMVTARSFGGDTVPAQGAYAGAVRVLEGPAPSASFTVDVPESGDYKIRAAGNSGEIVRRYELLIDGKPVPLETCLWLDMNAPISRRTWSEHDVAWFPGWDTRLSKGRHCCRLLWPTDAPAPKLILDAIAVQRS